MKVLVISSEHGRLKTVDIQNASALVLSDIHGNQLFVAGEHGISGLVTMASYQDADFSKLTRQLGLTHQVPQTETLKAGKVPHFG